nr:hypothetical protein [Tanacetum cinerariifolium]
MGGVREKVHAIGGGILHAVWGGEGDAVMLARWFGHAAVGVAIGERRRLRWCVGADVMEVVAAWSGGAWRDGDEGDDGEWRPEWWSKKGWLWWRSSESGRKQRQWLENTKMSRVKLKSCLECRFTSNCFRIRDVKT